MKKAVFLDRDGVIIREEGHYNYLPEHRIFVDRIFDFLKDLQHKGYLLIVITNQGAIAKGLFDHQAVHNMHAFIDDEMKKHHIQITHFYYCPHHSDISACLCRKPGYLNIQKAIHRYQIDPKKSYMIGDKESDVHAAESAGVKGILIPANVLSNINIL
jgi:D-glycero-D-manno-heptose 1,7-bisphosphate phosphatase